MALRGVGQRTFATSYLTGSDFLWRCVWMGRGKKSAKIVWRSSWKSGIAYRCRHIGLSMTCLLWVHKFTPNYQPAMTSTLIYIYITPILQYPCCSRERL